MGNISHNVEKISIKARNQGAVAWVSLVASHKSQVESGKCVGRIRAQPVIRHGGRSLPEKSQVARGGYKLQGTSGKWKVCRSNKGAACHPTWRT